MRFEKKERKEESEKEWLVAKHRFADIAELGGEREREKKKSEEDKNEKKRKEKKRKEKKRKDHGEDKGGPEENLQGS